MSGTTTMYLVLQYLFTEWIPASFNYYLFQNFDAATFIFSIHPCANLNHKKNPQQNNQPRKLKIACQQLCMCKDTGGKSAQTYQSCLVCWTCAHNVMDSASKAHLISWVTNWVWTHRQLHAAMGTLPAGFYFPYLQKLACICCELHSEPLI